MFNGSRVIAETNVMIIGDNAEAGLGLTCHSRFLDRVEPRDGKWRVALRQVIYDMSHFDLLDPSIEIDQGEVRKHPREYAALAYVLGESGLSIKQEFATKESGLEREIRAASEAWLREADHSSTTTVG